MNHILQQKNTPKYSFLHSPTVSHNICIYIYFIFFFFYKLKITLKVDRTQSKSGLIMSNDVIFINTYFFFIIIKMNAIYMMVHELILLVMNINDEDKMILK